MIIVHQNRRRTINFDKVEEFFVSYDKEEHKYLIKCTTVSGQKIVYGKYQSEKQAEEIINTFTRCYGLKGQALQFEDGSMQTQLPVYYMPLERTENQDIK